MSSGAIKKIYPRVLAVVFGLVFLTALGLAGYDLLGREGKTLRGFLTTDASAARQPRKNAAPPPGHRKPAKTAGAINPVKTTGTTGTTGTTESSESGENPVPVRIAAVTRGRVQDELRQNTTLVSKRVTAVFSPIPGIVRSVRVKEGDRVRPGLLMIQLDDRESRLKLAKARVAVARDAAEWKRQRTIRSEALEDRKEYRDALHGFNTWKITLQQKINDRRRKESEAKRLNLAYREKLASQKEKDDAGYTATQARLEEAEARLQMKNAEREWKRIKALDARKLIEDATFTTARFAYEASKAEMKLAALKVSQAGITAPVSAVVTERRVEPGDNISTNTRLLTLTDLNRLEAELRLPESQWFLVKRGQRVTISPVALPGKSFPGRVTRINPTIDPENGTFKITVSITGTGKGKLRPGMFAVVRIRTALRVKAKLIPRQAVLGDEDMRFVYIVKNGRAERRRITLGAFSGDRVEVRTGLKTGERVIVAGQHRLRPGRTVTVLK